MIPVFVKNIINEKAAAMPIVTETFHEVHHVDGSELIAQGHYELADGTKVVAGVQYKQNMPVVMAVNHRRRMVRAYKAHGWQGILDYMKHVLDVVKQNMEAAA
jgi:hypothetical protein